MVFRNTRQEAKKVLADINAGSQKVNRKLGGSPKQSSTQENPPALRSPRSPEREQPPFNVPLPPEPSEQNTAPPLVPRKSVDRPPQVPPRQSSNYDRPAVQTRQSSSYDRPAAQPRKSYDRPRPKNPKRSSSMRRAYNWVFGSGGHHHARTPSSENVNTDTNGSEHRRSQDDVQDSSAPVATENGEDTQEATATPSNDDGASASKADKEPETVKLVKDDDDASLQKLKDDLKWYKTELDNAGGIVSSQTTEIERLKSETDELRTQHEKEQASLYEQKKALEDHMVSVVVQQVKEARESERKAVSEKYEKQIVSEKSEA